MALKIANPIYDVVFKFLMEDKQAASILLSDLIGQEIIDLEFKPKEQTLKIKLEDQDKVLTVYRLDFKAKIRTERGEEKVILIEVQKARIGTELERFRKYLGEQYASRENIIDDYPVQRALPIISIYFLGFNLLELNKTPIIYVRKLYKDATTGEILHGSDSFIEALTHEVIVIQLPILKQIKPRNDVEHALSIFDPSTNKNIYIIDENLFPKRYKPILKRLTMAAANTEIVERMELENEIMRALTLQKMALERERKARLREREARLKEREARLKEREARLREREARLKLARETAKIMKETGVPLEQIARITGLRIEEIEEL